MAGTGGTAGCGAGEAAVPVSDGLVFAELLGPCTPGGPAGPGVPCIPCGPGRVPAKKFVIGSQNTEMIERVFV